eukprot:s5467_g1.t1
MIRVQCGSHWENNRCVLRRALGEESGKGYQPLFTYAVLRYIELKGEKTSKKAGLEIGLVLAAHTVLSVSWLR